MGKLTAAQLTTELFDLRWMEKRTVTDDVIRRRILRAKQRKLLFDNRDVILEALSTAALAQQGTET